MLERPQQIMLRDIEWLEDIARLVHCVLLAFPQIIKAGPDLFTEVLIKTKSTVHECICLQRYSSASNMRGFGKLKVFFLRQKSVTA